jgi:hypothetical protein
LTEFERRVPMRKVVLRTRMMHGADCTPVSP